MLRCAVFAAVLLAWPAHAEVKQAGPTGFVIEHRVEIEAPASKVWEVLRAPQKWWAKDHTWSGDSNNLYIDAQATGCFCERLPDKGSVEHAHIVYSAPGSVLRMKGALGPLQAEAATGTLSFVLIPLSGTRTQLTLTYVVGGYVAQGMEAIAAPVDQVLSEQMAHLKAAAEPLAPAPPPAPPEPKREPGSLELDLNPGDDAPPPDAGEPAPPPR